MKLLWLLVFGLALTASSFGEGNPTGNNLLNDCTVATKEGVKTGAENYDQGYCTGLVNALLFAGYGVCPATGVTTGQGIKIVLKFLNDHPDKLHLDDALLGQQALSEAFPCKK